MGTTLYVKVRPGRTTDPDVDSTFLRRVQVGRKIELYVVLSDDKRDTGQSLRPHLSGFWPSAVSVGAVVTIRLFVKFPRPT